MRTLLPEAGMISNYLSLPEIPASDNKVLIYCPHPSGIDISLTWCQWTNLENMGKYIPWTNDITVLLLYKMSCMIQICLDKTTAFMKVLFLKITLTEWNQSNNILNISYIWWNMELQGYLEAYIYFHFIIVDDIFETLFFLHVLCNFVHVKNIPCSYTDKFGWWLKPISK